MRLNEVARIDEDIEWNPGHQETYMSLKALVNHTNGVYKSEKQKKFLEATLIKNEPAREAAFMKSNYGVEMLDPSNKVVMLSGYYRWADYGARSMIPFFYAFEMDQYGVVALWKIGAHGNLKIGAGPDPKKAKREWVRPEGVDTSHLEPSKEQAKKEFLKSLGKASGKYIGTEGEKKHDFGSVVVKVVKELESYVVAYNIAAERWFHVFEDANGDVIWYTGKHLGVKPGQTIKLRGTVKKHLISKRMEHVTIVSHPKIEKELFTNQEVTEPVEKT
jgi:hypothetical protein